MTHRGEAWIHAGRWLGRVLAMLALTAGVVVLMLWLAGKFEAKVPVLAEMAPAPAAEVRAEVVPVLLRKIPMYERRDCR